MSAWTYGAEFAPGRYSLPRVRSIASDGAVIAHVNCGFGDGENQAKLIAAAPDMAEALRLAEQRIEQLCSTVNTLAKFRKVRAADFAEEIRAALAKAGL